MADPLPTIALGKGLAAPSTVDNALSQLTGKGIAVADETGVRMRKGSSGEPIMLPSLQHMGFDTSFPSVIVQNAEGVLYRLDPNEGADKYVLHSRNGSFRLEPLLGAACFPEDEICECPPDQVAGWREVEQEDGSTKWCLVRFTPSADSDVWEDSQTVDIQGAGTLADPYNANVKISTDPGNLIELRADGLFVGASS